MFLFSSTLSFGSRTVISAGERYFSSLNPSPEITRISASGGSVAMVKLLLTPPAHPDTSTSTTAISENPFMPSSFIHQPSDGRFCLL